MTDRDITKQVNDALTRVARSGSPIEFAKLSSALYDRLVVIDGAALTVSLSAIGSHYSMYGGNLSRFGQRALEVAWVAFILSIILALATNWIHVSIYAKTGVYEAAADATLLIDDLLKDNHIVRVGEEARWGINRLREVVGSTLLELKSGVLRRRWAGAGAQLCTIIGFIAMGAFLFAALRR